MNTRLAKASTVFRRLSNIWKSGSLGLNIKLQLYTAVVMTTALYASETWKRTSKMRKKLDVFHQRNLRRIIGMTRKVRVTNKEVLERTKQRRLQDIVEERRFRFAGHILRMATERPAYCAMDWTPTDGKRRRGRSKNTWRSTFREDLQA